MSTNYVPPQPKPTQAWESTSAQQNAYTQPQQVNAQQPSEGYSQGYDYQQPSEGYPQGQPAANYTYNQFPYAQPSYSTGGYAPNAQTSGYSNPQWNNLAILSVVFLFVFMPASLALGFLALSEIKKTGERGKVLAIVSICVSGFFVALFVMAFFVLSLFGMVIL